MPKNYDPTITPPNEQRRAKNVMTDEWIVAFLAHARIGHIVTLWDAQPFINPTTFWYDAPRHRIIFHSNIVGRMRANAEHHDRVCFETSEFGRFLPSNIALEFSVQYESVIAYGTIAVLTDLDEKRAALSGLIGKYFPTMSSGAEYRPITEIELKQTSVYAIAIDQWSGKRNWADQADQSDEWPALTEDVVNYNHRPLGEAPTSKPHISDLKSQISNL